MSINYTDLIYNIENKGGTFKARNKKAQVCQFEGCNEFENLEAHHINPMISSKRKDLSI